MKSKDARFNNHFLRNEFLSNEIYDIPVIQRDEIDISCIDLIGFNNVKAKDNNKHLNKFIHFFLDDYKFNSVYDCPEKYIARIKSFIGVLSPDFSLYTDMAQARQIEHTFKNRWCGAFWQSHGIKVIPTIGWSDERSFDFCFAGVEKGSIVAVSTVGSRRAKSPFMKGYTEMLRRIEPGSVICYGSPFDEMEGNIVYIDYLQVTNRKNEKKQNQYKEQLYLF
jgi:hypothetical protein